MDIKLKDITSAPWNPRTDITPESVAELAKDIETNGLIEPITLWNDGKGNLYCIAGNRRLAAFILARGENGVLESQENPCPFNFFVGTEEEARALTFRENHHRLNLSPLGEAEQIARFVKDGMTLRDAALALGINEKKARRRSRLNDLTDAWKKRTDLTVDILEKVASFPPSVQDSVARRLWNGCRSWSDMARQFDSETQDLDRAQFEKKACHKCVNRTGAEADLFGVADGSLGRCIDCECFQKKYDAWKKAKIEELTKGASEVVECESTWEMPDLQVSSEKKTKKCPCAYIHFGDEIVVRWSESKKERKARELAEEEARQLKREKEREACAREDEIVDKLDLWKNGSDEVDECCEGLDELIEEKVGSNVAQDIHNFVVEAVADKIDTWQDASGWARVLRAFPKIAELASVSEDDMNYLIDNNPDED